MEIRLLCHFLLEFGFCIILVIFLFTLPSDSSCVLLWFEATCIVIDKFGNCSVQSCFRRHAKDLFRTTRRYTSCSHPIKTAQCCAAQSVILLYWRNLILYLYCCITYASQHFEGPTPKTTCTILCSAILHRHRDLSDHTFLITVARGVFRVLGPFGD